MKYLDSSGKHHDKWHKAIWANIKLAVKPDEKGHPLMDTSPDGDRYQVPESYYYEGHPVAPSTPNIARAAFAQETQQARELDFDGDLAKLNRFVIDYEAATITAYDPQGVKLAESKIDERLLYGLAEQVIVDKVEELTDASPEEIAKLAAQVNMVNADDVSRVVAAASGKNCIMSPAFSNEFMECAAKNITTALSIRPVATKESRQGIVKQVLLETEKIINGQLSQADKDEEAKG